MSDKIPAPPWAQPDYQDELAMAKLALLLYPDDTLGVHSDEVDTRRCAAWLCRSTR